MAEKKQQQEQQLQEVLENQEPEAPTNMVGGYMVYQQNDNCELREGDLEAPWKEKFDDETGRKYFKNTEDKFTTWVDPRTHKVRPHDPSACEKGWLPFGWDKAETESGVVFYIDHLNNTHHKDSPREILDQKQAAYEHHQQLRAKLERVTVELNEATEEAGRQQQEARSEELNKVIAEVEGKLNKFRGDVQLMADRIASMKAQKSLSKLNP